MNGSPVSELRRDEAGPARRAPGCRETGATHRAPWRDETGSAVAEFVMVVALLTLMTLAVIQLAFALHIRNTLLDAASEGARFASLADSGVDAGATRTRELIVSALGESYARNVTANSGDWMGHPAVTVTVSAPLPLVGLVGVDRGLEVVGHAPLESLE